MSDEPISISLARPQTALEQIGARLDGLLQRFKASSLVVKVGDSAAHAIACQTQDHRVPNLIKGVSVVRTADFRGWEVFHNGREVD